MIWFQFQTNLVLNLQLSRFLLLGETFQLLRTNCEVFNRCFEQIYKQSDAYCVKMLAYDFRNPLKVIDSYSYLLQHEEFVRGRSESAARGIKYIKNRIQEIVNYLI